MRIGWIGTGIMGRSMAEHLIRAGHSLQVYNRTASKADSLISLGAKFSSIADLASTSDIVLTMVGYPYDVEEVVLGSNGVLQNLRSGCLFIDHTSSSPSLAIKINRLALEKGIDTLDAPVSGGDIGAREGKLAIMVGVSESSFRRGLDIMKVYGANVELMGEAGS